MVPALLNLSRDHVVSRRGVVKEGILSKVVALDSVEHILVRVMRPGAVFDRILDEPETGNGEIIS